MPAWWKSSENLARRLQLETLAMQAAFGNTFQLKFPDDGPIYWIGKVEVNLTGVSYREHTLKIVYPDSYPSQPPEAYVMQPIIHSEKYQFEDGKLSLFNPKDGPNYGWNPASSTALTITGWAIQWLYAYYTAQALGKWPEPYGIDG
jgi:ubiquitin-protein ligase